jgi:sigma-E factor negative regulatory protein RseB
MVARSLSRLAVACACAALASPALQAQAPAAAAAPAATLGAGEVRAWLLRIHEAASRRNFQGTFVVSAGGTVASSRIAHYCDGSNQYERVEALDGEMRRVYRLNSTVHTLWPQSRVAVVERRDSLGAFPALLHEGDHAIVDHYDVRSIGLDRVAGHEAQVLLLTPRDAHRFGHRLWAERETGLLLRAEVIGERSEVLEAAAFSDVSVGVKAQSGSVRQGMARLDGYRVVRPLLVATRLEDEGWALRPPVAGFLPVSCVRRPLDAVGPAVAEAAPEVVQAIYSDGLTHVSLFIEPYDAARHGKAMQTAIGATHTVMRRQGDWWVTAVGDVPAATLKLFVGALERRKP